MRPPKDRLYRAIVFGATPAGIAATNKLAELGIRVTLIDSDPDLNHKLAREEWQLPSGIPLNFAHRAGLIRILRDSSIRLILPAQVVSLKHTHQGFRAQVKTIETFIDPESCTLCGRCSQICPVITPDGEKPIRFNERMSLPGRPIIDKRQQPFCQESCPLGVNAQAYIALAKEGRYHQALEVVRRDNILPGICGRVCTHPCEESCRRGDLDEPIAIRDIKRFLADYELINQIDPVLPELPSLKEKIAVIGSGPAGLAAATDLIRFGYDVTIFEKDPQAGGLLRYGIGRYRLPRNILDYELKYIQKLGVKIETSHPIDILGDIDKLQKDFDSVILTVGASSDRLLGIPGEDFEGVEKCISFLHKINEDQITDFYKDIAVIGDGNSAFDLARTLRRLGSQVSIISWFREDSIPASKEEITGAKEEGIEIIDQTQVILFLGKNGQLNGLRCKPTEPGKTDPSGIAWPRIIQGSKAFELSFEQVIVAIGQNGLFVEDSKKSEINITENGLIAVDDNFRTNIRKVYAAGDIISGPSSVVDAMASGRHVAKDLHKDLNKDNKPLSVSSLRPKERYFKKIPEEIPSLARVKMPESQPAFRCDNFSEVALGLNEAQILSETGRCLQCGICSECLLCLDVCSEIGAINHAEQPRKTTEHAGVIIIADPKIVPPIKGEDVIRAYGPKTAKSNVLDMISRGFASAAMAMKLMGGISHHPKGHGISFSPPDPVLSPEIRVGIFACKCNNAYGWLDTMDEYINSLVDQKDVVHSQILSAACTKEGSTSILRAIRDKNITRVVLASCVCCPLDFICSACTDQRSRLKDALFNGTGVSRAMVETCNLRGEVLRLIPVSESRAFNLLTGLIERSIFRAKKLKPLPSPARNYNFTTAVIGISEASFYSAKVLAETGYEVFMFGSHEKFLLKNHPNVHCFENYSVKELSGSLGDFKILIQLNGFSQVVNAGAVILGGKYNRLIPYIPQAGFPVSSVATSIQSPDLTGIPFLLPGTTSTAGLFLANPPGINISERTKGTSAAVLAATIMPHGPRQSKGFTVTIDKNKCRGCGRCINNCIFQAITFHGNSVGGWYAEVDEALCKGCGNCISVCPTNAADSPYRNQAYLEELLEEVLVG